MTSATWPAHDSGTTTESGAPGFRPLAAPECSRHPRRLRVDPALLRAAEYQVDLGPGAGQDDGQLVFAGVPAELARSGDSPTARALRGLW